MVDEVRVEIIGGDLLRAALLGITANEEEASRRAIRDMALRLINYAKREASGPARTGVPRRNRRGMSVPYRAGGPGVVTGHLRRSILPIREGRIGAH
ncbi:MAG: hypothetical protein IRY90_22485, partial [Actinomadura rubrobrunea]|nr:hypothetical protein [Actinomadura rubrobrunea]